MKVDEEITDLIFRHWVLGINLDSLAEGMQELLNAERLNGHSLTQKEREKMDKKTFVDRWETFFYRYPKKEREELEKQFREDMDELLNDSSQLEPQKTADINFLVNRTMKAGTCNFTDERDTGSSSNSIVAIAYGAQELKDQILPGDMGDLNACKNMWKKLPEHRKTEDAKKAMERAENFRNEKTIF